MVFLRATALRTGAVRLLAAGCLAVAVPAIVSVTDPVLAQTSQPDGEAAALQIFRSAQDFQAEGLGATGEKRIDALHAALDALLDIVDWYPHTALARRLSAGERIEGLSIADLSTLLDGLEAVDPITAAEAEARADRRERMARDDTIAGGAADTMTTGAITPTPQPAELLDIEAPSLPARDTGPKMSAEEAIAACDALAASPNDAKRTAGGVWQTVMDTEAAVLACTAAVKAAPDTGRLEFQLGRAVYRSGDAKASALLFGQAATHGHMAAQAQLGLMLIAGEGASRDVERGFALVKGAADAGDPFAVAMLGELTMHGIGAAKDEPQGLQFYRKAAQAGSPIGMQRLAEALADGLGAARDDGAALDWLNKAVGAGAPTAHYMLGVFYRDGRIVKKDATAAFSHFRLAAMAGEARALYEVGAAYMNGTGVPADQREGVSWMRRAAQAGVSDSYYSLAYAHAFGRGTDRNAGEAARFMLLSLKANSRTAFEQMTRNPDQWPPDMRRELQQQMKDAGVYASSVDGSFGPATLQAIMTLAGG